MNSSKKIYWIVSAFSFAGYVWVGFHFLYIESNLLNFEVCFFKNITGLPCVSCGITRSIMEILHGHFIEAMLINPLGIFAVCLLLISPTWIVFDVYTRRETLPVTIVKGEALLRSYKVYLPLIVLGLLNWYWNIIKEL